MPKPEHCINTEHLIAGISAARAASDMASDRRTRIDFTREALRQIRREIDRRAQASFWRDWTEAHGPLSYATQQKRNSMVLAPTQHREAAYLIPHLLHYVGHRTHCKAVNRVSTFCTCDLTALVQEVIAWQSGETEDIDGGIPPWERKSSDDR